MRLCLTAILLLVTGVTGSAQNVHNWDSLGTLHAGDKLRVSVKGSAPVYGDFQNFTAQHVQIGAVTVPKEHVLRVEQYTNAGGRSRRAVIGALIGFGGGFAVGAAAGGCSHNQIGPCFSRGETGAVAGAGGAVVGAVIGALLPHQSRELIYSAP